MDALEEKLDELFSLYTRLRFVDYRGYVRCFTCAFVAYWREFDAGHWIKRSNHAVRWDEENARPQCVDCNRFKAGLPDVFEEELRAEIGDDAVDELMARSVNNRYLSEDEKRELTIHYSKLVKQLDSTL